MLPKDLRKISLYIVGKFTDVFYSAHLCTFSTECSLNDGNYYFFLKLELIVFASVN